MKEKLQKIADYFKKQIVEGNYEFIECDKHYAKVLIADEFLFAVWMANEVDGVQIYEHAMFNSINSKFIEFSEEEKKQTWEILNKHVVTFNKNDVDRKIQDLENQIKTLKNDKL